MKDYLLTLKIIEPVNAGISRLTFVSDDKLEPITGGQFAQLEVPDKTKILRRPICIYDYGEYEVVFVIAAAGGGTRSITSLKPGDKIRALMPLGNGFKLRPEHKKVLLLGGGVGCAPLHAVMQTYSDREYYSYLSFSRAEDVCFEADFAAKSRLTLCTSDGSRGRKGHATDIAQADFARLVPDVVLICGSASFMREAQKIVGAAGIEGYLSAESRMGCGIGACLVCTCKVKGNHGIDGNKRVCADGPVFEIGEIIL